MATHRRRRFALRHVAVAVVLALPLLSPVAAPVALAAPEDDLAEAQRRANRAAAELSGAQEQVARTEAALAEAQARVERIDAQVEQSREQVRQLAIRLYVEGTTSLSRLFRMADANQVILAQQYRHVIAGSSTDSLLQFRAEREDLAAEVGALERQRESHDASLSALTERQADIVGELEELRAAVERAEAAREAQQQARAQARPTGNTPAETESAPEPSSSAEDSGGRDAITGGGSGWVCPVHQPRAFSNDYGAPRPGGRSHQGNDILAPRGTAVVANVSGTVSHRTGNISGKAYFLHGDDGNRYFGAHLDSFGASGRVSAGTQIGSVGTTGDAAGGPPHLHFEKHPGGSGNVNPYSTLVQHC